jgi:hypothetical protein
MPSKTIAGPVLAACLFLPTSAAHAETWADTGHTTLIDVDSISKHEDGLVYYSERQKYPDDPADNPPSTGAYDCAKGIFYSPYSIKYKKDWRLIGVGTIHGTMGEALQNFVCSRAK